MSGASVSDAPAYIDNHGNRLLSQQLWLQSQDRGLLSYVNNLK